MGDKKVKIKNKFFHNSIGFTLIELIIVIAVIAIVAIGVFLSLDPAKRIGESQDAQRWADLTSIAKAIELYAADNGQVPSDFNLTNLAQGEKFVLCSSAASRSCDGQTETCLAVNDADFLGVYLPTLPIDPEKSSTSDTGYYVTRGSGDSIVLGACSPYTSASVEIKSQISLPTLVAVCGDGDVEGSEVCDDGDTSSEGCSNGVLETAGTYCNSTCTATIVISSNEVCDYIGWSLDCYTLDGWYTESSAGKDDYCKSDCLAQTDFCQLPP